MATMIHRQSTFEKIKQPDLSLNSPWNRNAKVIYRFSSISHYNIWNIKIYFVAQSQVSHTMRDSVSVLCFAGLLCMLTEGLKAHRIWLALVFRVVLNSACSAHNTFHCTWGIIEKAPVMPSEQLIWVFERTVNVPRGSRKHWLTRDESLPLGYIFVPECFTSSTSDDFARQTL